jgi:hypothetical protein
MVESGLWIVQEQRNRLADDRWALECCRVGAAQYSWSGFQPTLTVATFSTFGTAFSILSFYKLHYSRLSSSLAHGFTPVEAVTCNCILVNFY